MNIILLKNHLNNHKKKLIDFCNNQNKYINYEIENNIRLFDVNINGINFQMYSTKKIIGLSKRLFKYKVFEKVESLNILGALKYYGNIKKIKNNGDIIMIDIGGNVGWYPSFLGRYNYTIISFEPFQQNFYISCKNYCHLNKNSNVILINRGLDIDEKICSYYKDKNSLLNGMTLCEDNNNSKNISVNNFIKKGSVYLTKLSNYIPFLPNKNVALIKIDVEGAEEIAIKGGVELITRYHVPFIFIEFTPRYLLKHNSSPRNFLQFFVDNDYVISLRGFLNKNFISIDDLILKTKFQINIYLIYKKIIDF